MLKIRRHFLSLVVVSYAFVALVALSSRSFAERSEQGFDASAFESRLRDDWLMQDAPHIESDGPLFAERLDTTAEFSLVRRVLDETVRLESYDVKRVDELETRLAMLRDSTSSANDPRWEALYYDACLCRRSARLADAVELSPQFVYTKHYVFGASHYAYTEDVSDEAYFDTSVNRQDGGQLCLATFMPDGSIEHEVLVEVSEGSIRDPEVSWDGSEIVFSMRNSFETDDYHLYIYNVSSGETRQITFGLGVADIEPAWLPSGDLIFVSTRCGQNIDCWWTEASNLYTCDAQGRFLRRVSVDQVTVNYPKVLDDGRVVYTRWEYNDRGHIYVQPLFQMNPDGSGQTEFYGNNSLFPTSLLHTRGIPGSGERAISIASGHHTYQEGKLVVVDRAAGTQGNSGITLVAQGRPQPEEVMVDRYGRDGELFTHPFALDDANIFVSYLPEGSQDRSYKIPYGVYWFDFDGSRELLAYDPSISCNQPAPLVSREVPTTRASQVDLRKDTGTYYVQDVYEGPGLVGVPRGVVKKLRVVELLYRPFSVGWNWNFGPVGDSMVTCPPSVGNGSWDAKRVLGEVPVESDGSAYFEVPAMTPVYFQLLDEHGDVVQTMRSWSTLQPGETFACVGCHEAKDTSVQNSLVGGATSEALRKGVAQLTPSAGASYASGFDFVRDVQPILDEYCVRCHSGLEGEAFSLRGDEERVPAEGSDRRNIYDVEKRRFSESYLTLTEYGRPEGRWVRWLGVQDSPALLPPYYRGAANSPLIIGFRSAEAIERATTPDSVRAEALQIRADLASRGFFDAHQGVELDADSLATLATWIDLLVPYCGDYYEHNRWTNGERAYYRYYKGQHDANASIDKGNVELKRIFDATGIAPNLDAFEQFQFGGKETRRLFVNKLLECRAPSIAFQQGAENVYRNLAYNPADKRVDKMGANVYPHATSNSEYGLAEEFASLNAIDGFKGECDSVSSGGFWRPNLRSDMWLNVDFGCDVVVDKCVLYLRSGSGDGWSGATLRFSDGSSEELALRDSGEAQVFTFAPRRVSEICLTDFQGDLKSSGQGIVEVEYWGRTYVEER